jgi:hypothetical protein
VFSQIWLTYFLDDHLFDYVPKSLEENPVHKGQKKKRKKSDEAKEVIIQKAV